MSKHWAWFPPEVHTNTGRLCSVGSGCHPVPRRHCSSAALRLPAPFSRGSGSPCQRPPSWRALVLCPRGPTTRAPAYASCAGDSAPALHNAGVSSRRGEGLPGSWTVLFVRAMVEHPAGYKAPPHPEKKHLHAGVVVAFDAIQRSRHPGSLGFGAAVPRPARSPAYASLIPFLASAQGLLPARAGSPLAGRISHPLDDERSFMKSSHLQSPSTSRAWSHCISYPPGSCNWRDNARPSVDLPAPPAPGMPMSETGGRRRGPPAPTTRGLPRRRSGRLWASLPIAEYGTTARPTLWADGRFPGETGPCPPGPGPCRLCPSPTACAGSPNT